jgi:hypothetical protein
MDADQWCTKLIVLTWDFVHNSWQLQNDNKHGKNGNELVVQKEKLIRKILWSKTKITSFPNK